MYIQENWVNKTENYMIGDSGIYEPYTDDIGKLYHTMQREYGRCIGYMYADKADKPIKIGWVFLKRVKYERSNDTYLQETWVTLHDNLPTKTIIHHYHQLS